MNTSLSLSAGCASSRWLSGSKDVKEDLKKLFLSISQKYQPILIVREQQIYGFDQHMWQQNRYFACSPKLLCAGEPILKNQINH